MTLIQTAPKKIYIWVDVQPITTAWIYHNSDLWLISLSSDGNTRTTIADKNLGATTVYNDGDTLSQTNWWNYYQRWNCYWFAFTWPTSTSTTTVNAGNYWPTNYYSSSTFIKAQQWDSSNNANLRWWTTWTNDAMKWPCESWYHIMTNTEWNSIYQIWVSLWAWASWQWDNMKLYLKLPYWWLRTYSTWWWSNIWSAGYYWASIQRASWTWYALKISSSETSPQTSGVKWIWMPIRPLKNDAVQPREWWTVLYQ